MKPEEYPTKKFGRSLPQTHPQTSFSVSRIIGADKSNNRKASMTQKYKYDDWVRFNTKSHGNQTPTSGSNSTGIRWRYKWKHAPAITRKPIAGVATRQALHATSVLWYYGTSRYVSFMKLCSINDLSFV